ACRTRWIRRCCRTWCWRMRQGRCAEEMRMRSIAVVLSVCVLAGYAAGQERPKITGVSHLSVYTSDAAKAEFFYVHDLGAFKALDPQDPQGARYYFNPMQFVEVLPLPGGWTSVSRFDHAGYNTTDAEQMRRYLKAHGIAVPDAV